MISSPVTLRLAESRGIPIVTSRERVINVIEGGLPDRMPVAPMFWASEYSWRLVNRPIWQTIHGPAEIFLERLAALDVHHPSDWLLVMFPGTNLLNAKTLVCEDLDGVVFTDDNSGDEWLFDKRTRRLEPTVKQEVISYVPRNRDEARSLLVAQNCTNPMIAPTAGVRALFPDKFLCGAVPTPFSELANYLGFNGRALLMKKNPALCSWMAEILLGDVEALSLGYANDGLDAAILVDWWEPAGLDHYVNWIAPLHRRIATALTDAGLKSIFYVHRGDTCGNLSEALKIISSLEFDAFAFEESGDSIEMDMKVARAVLGNGKCIFGNLDPRLLLASDLDSARVETLKQYRQAGMPFVIGTGSAILDHTDPLVLDFWLSFARNI